MVQILQDQEPNTGNRFRELIRQAGNLGAYNVIIGK
jgi:hypothetical protein